MPTVTGQNIPGYSSEQHRAAWSGYFTQFESAGVTVTFKGKTRTVRWLDRTHTLLGVLDEAHGEIEVLDRSAKHQGIRQIAVTYNMVQRQIKKIVPVPKKASRIEYETVSVPDITNIALNPLRAVTGGKAHQYTFQGGLNA
ncbi:MAG TPA: hypothetical protein VM597_18210 [Gemmataceae bacterium]|nr:hypothetical protein [Gemmataceae bacterium]